MMIAHLRHWCMACLVGSVALGFWGCRDVEPTPSHYRDLGDGERVLLPTGSPWYDLTGKASGSAEWVPFTEPDELVAEAAEADEEGEDATGGAEDEEEGGVEDELRELVDEYNEVAAKGDVEELLEYHVEAQQETIEAMFNSAVAMKEKLEELRTALKNKLPDMGQRVDDAIDMLVTGVGSPDLVVDSFSVESETEIIGSPPAGSSEPKCRFKSDGDYWYIEIIDLPDYAQMKPQIDMLMGAFDGWVQGLQSGQMQAETVLGQVETQAKAMKAAQGQSGTSAAGSESAEGEAEEEAPEEGETEEDTEGG